MGCHLCTCEARWADQTQIDIEPCGAWKARHAVGASRASSRTRRVREEGSRMRYMVCTAVQARQDKVGQDSTQVEIPLLSHQQQHLMLD